MFATTGYDDKQITQPHHVFFHIIQSSKNIFSTMPVTHLNTAKNKKSTNAIYFLFYRLSTKADFKINM